MGSILLLRRRTKYGAGVRSEMPSLEDYIHSLPGVGERVFLALVVMAIRLEHVTLGVG
jgi:hypothetical protein